MKYLTYYENGEIISTKDHREAVERLEKKNKGKAVQRFILHKYAYVFSLAEVEDKSQYYLCRKQGDRLEVYLEKKNVQGNLVCKQIETVTEEESSRILEGDITWMKEDERPLVRDFYLQSVLNGLEYSHMMEFVREVFHYEKQDMWCSIRQSAARSGTTSWNAYLKMMYKSVSAGRRRSRGTY